MVDPLVLQQLHDFLQSETTLNDMGSTIITRLTFMTAWCNYAPAHLSTIGSYNGVSPHDAKPVFEPAKAYCTLDV